MTDFSPDQLPSLEDYQAEQLRAARSAIRQKIGKQAGDLETLVGITADAAALSTLFLAADLAALAGASSFNEYKSAKLAAIQGLAGEGEEPVALAGAFLAQVQAAAEAGTPLLPIQLKGGLSVVLADIQRSGAAVAAVLAAASQSSGTSAEQ